MSALKKTTALCYVFPQVSLELNVGRYGQTQSTYVLHRLSRTTTLLAFEYLYPPCRAFYGSAQNFLTLSSVRDWKTLWAHDWRYRALSKTKAKRSAK